MKTTPWRAETRVASILSALFRQYGLGDVKRVPITGRTGPDIEINSAGLCMEVKSWKAIPVSILPKRGQILTDGRFYFVQLKEIETLFGQVEPYPINPSKIVDGIYKQIDGWVEKEFPQGISALSLHRVGTTGDTFVIHRLDVSILENRLKGLRSVTPPGLFRTRRSYDRHNDRVHAGRG